MKRFVLLTLAIVVAIPALASVQQKIQIQGVLRDNTGAVMPDNDYSVHVEVFDAPTAGLRLYDTDTEIIQDNGVFTLLLSGFYPNTFDQDTWLEITWQGEPDPMGPRIPIIPVPVALCASTVDPDAAVVRLNGLKGQVNLVAGDNVTIVPSGNDLTIHATAGAGGEDGDWEIVGEDLYRTTGRIYVGEYKAGKARSDGEKTFPADNKIEVQAIDEGIAVLLEQTSTSSDGKGALYGYRYAPQHNNGTGFAATTSNAAVTGYNDSNDSHTFGVSAFGISAGLNNGALLAADNLGNSWSSLVYRDGTGNTWGLFTPQNIHSSGLTETHTLRVSNGATAGYILTSDAAGYAVWSPPAAATSDGDWTISGAGLYHTGYGAVALGTSTPHNWADNPDATTLQIRSPSAPTLALDTQYAAYTPLYRWTLTGGVDGIKFNSSGEIASEGTTALRLSETSAEFNNASGDLRIALRTEADMDDGGAIDLFGSLSANPTLHLDGLAGTGGGRISVNDAGGSPEVVITANHNNTGVGRITTPVLEITGGSDLSEQFDLGNAMTLASPGMVVSIDPENPGRLTLSDRSYDRRVAGVISGAGGVNTGMVMGQQGSVADGELPVALVGRVYVMADASDGPIEPGDLLTTADVPGHAMKVTDHHRATGAILGKAMTGLKEGRGLVLTLVSLQ